MMVQGKAATGRRGEDEAADFLTSIGHLVLERNWRHSHKEVDIISLFGNELHIVEVKAKNAPVVADPVLSVGKTKQRFLVEAANAYLHSSERNDLPKDLEIMFDIVSVVFDGDTTTVEYYPQAYIPTYV